VALDGGAGALPFPQSHLLMGCTPKKHRKSFQPPILVFRSGTGQGFGFGFESRGWSALVLHPMTPALVILCH
jgi:hypothetical protein